MLSFVGKAAIITGAGQGIGLEIAQVMAAQGAAILLNDLDENLATEAAFKIRKQGFICEAFVGNVSEIDTIQKMVAEAIRLFGKLDIVVANAGITTFGDFFEWC